MQHVDNITYTYMINIKVYYAMILYFYFFDVCDS